MGRGRPPQSPEIRAPSLKLEAAVQKHREAEDGAVSVRLQRGLCQHRLGAQSFGAWAFARHQAALRLDQVSVQDGAAVRVRVLVGKRREVGQKRGHRGAHPRKTQSKYVGT